MNFVPCRHGRRRMFASKNARVSQQGSLEHRFKPPVESSDLIFWSQAPKCLESDAHAVVPPMMSEKINRPTFIGMMTA